MVITKAQWLFKWRGHESWVFIKALSGEPAPRQSTEAVDLKITVKSGYAPPGTLREKMVSVFCGSERELYPHQSARGIANVGLSQNLLMGTFVQAQRGIDAR